MRKLAGFAFCIFLASGGTSQLMASNSPAQAGSSMAAPAAQAADKTAPSYDLKAQAALDLADLQKKFTGLAEAIPAEKYSWRPEAGVRSINELFLHVAAAGFGFPTMMGTAPAPGFDGKGFEKSTTDKAKIIDWLNKSFTYSIAAVNSMSNADFAKALPKLGPDANEGDVIYLMVVHAHEHLGQSIAYARANGVVPPWTAAAAKKNPQAPQD
jgi:uncharacterized damage-inducible protein DinB